MFLAICAAPVSATQGEVVPAGLALKAGLRPIDFAATLVEAGVPVGVELSSSSDLPDVSSVVAVPTSPTITMSVLIAAFNRAHSEYRAIEENGVVIIRPVANRSASLDRQIALADALWPDGPYAVQAILSTLDPSLRISGGVVVAGGLPADDNGQMLYTPSELGPIRLKSGTLTIRKALNSVITQVPRHGWVAVSEQGAKGQVVLLRVGLLRRQGWLTRVALNDPVIDGR